jgi:hypothetical protein
MRFLTCSYSSRCSLPPLLLRRPLIHRSASRACGVSSDKSTGMPAMQQCIDKSTYEPPMQGMREASTVMKGNGWAHAIPDRNRVTCRYLACRT